MIQPGQKLKEGDWHKPMSESEAKEILDTMKIKYNDWYPKSCAENGIHYHKRSLWEVSHDPKYLDKSKEYNFADFRQLCENTFGDGN